MTFWTVLAIVSLTLGCSSGALCRNPWIAVLVSGLLAALLAPYLGLRFVQDVTGHHDAQDGLAFLFGPFVAVPVAVFAALIMRWLRRRKPA